MALLLGSLRPLGKGSIPSSAAALTTPVHMRTNGWWQSLVRRPAELPLGLRTPGLRDTGATSLPQCRTQAVSDEI